LQIFDKSWLFHQSLPTVGHKAQMGHKLKVKGEHASMTQVSSSMMHIKDFQIPSCQRKATFCKVIETLILLDVHVAFNQTTRIYQLTSNLTDTHA